MTRPRIVPPNDVAEQHSVATFKFVVDDAVRRATIAGPRLPGDDHAALVEAAGILHEHFARVATGAHPDDVAGPLPTVRVEGRILVSGTCHWIARPDVEIPDLDTLLPLYAERIARFVRTPSRVRVVAPSSLDASLATRLLHRTTAP